MTDLLVGPRNETVTGIRASETEFGPADPEVHGTRQEASRINDQWERYLEKLLPPSVIGPGARLPGLTRDALHPSYRVTDAVRAMALQTAAAFTCGMRAASVDIGDLKVQTGARPGGALFTVPEQISFLRSIPGWIMDAELYLLRAQLAPVIVEHPMPRHVLSPDLLPHRRMFVALEEPGEYGGPYGDSGEDLIDVRIQWLLLIDDASHDSFWLILGLHGLGQSARMGVSFASFRYHHTWPHDFGSDGRLEFVLKFLGFINSSFSESHRTQHARPLRKRLVAETGPPRYPSDMGIRITVLRRRGHGATPSEGNGKGPHYRHQWWVTGHFRAQWYPSKDAHQVLWIAPYIKGPAGKPMLHHAYDVRR